MESKATAQFNPEWHVKLDKIDSKEKAMALHAFATSHPVIQKLQTVDQTSQAFNSITYQKGEAVITMLEAFAGADVWRAGIRPSIKNYALGRASCREKVCTNVSISRVAVSL